MTIFNDVDTADDVVVDLFLAEAVCVVVDATSEVDYVAALDASCCSPLLVDSRKRDCLLQQEFLEVLAVAHYSTP